MSRDVFSVVCSVREVCFLFELRLRRATSLSAVNHNFLSIHQDKRNYPSQR